MQIMFVQGNGITEFEEFRCCEYLKSLQNDNDNHIVFFNEGNLFSVTGVDHFDQVHATSSDDEHIVMDFNKISKYLVIEAD